MTKLAICGAVQRVARAAGALLLITGFAASQPVTAPARPDAFETKASARLRAALQHGPADALVYFAPAPRPTPALADVAAQRAQMVAHLQAHAAARQLAARTRLAAGGAEYRELWLTNALWVRAATRDLLAALADDAAVVALTVDDHWPLPAAQAVGPPPGAGDALPRTNANEWGVERVGAPWAWARGISGTGIVIANLDTGVRWDHEALLPGYRGNVTTPITHAYHWFDPTGLSPAVPSDDQGHGTHTTGTSIGQGGIGVAPGAQWIGCRNMLAGVGSVARYTACFQFALAPTDLAGQNPRPDLAADITSNSWGCEPAPPWSEAGCDNPGALGAIIETLRAAGILVIASAGNDGPGCATVRTEPATQIGAFAVGAVNSSHVIASFSSRGPSTLNGARKPEVVAPGVSVRSSTRATSASYGELSGTSMAAPHVAGVAALVWSAAPWLRGHVRETEQLMVDTATPMTNTQTGCGALPNSISPNNTFGHGMINAELALTRVLSEAWLVALAPPVSGEVGVPFTIPMQASSLFKHSHVPTASLVLTAPAGLTWQTGCDVIMGQRCELNLSFAPVQTHTRALGVVASVTGTFAISAGWHAPLNGVTPPATANFGNVLVLETGAMPTATGTPTPSPTSTPTPSPTNTPTPSPTPAATSTSTPTITPASTMTPTPLTPQRKWHLPLIAHQS